MPMDTLRCRKCNRTRKIEYFSNVSLWEKFPEMKEVCIGCVRKQDKKKRITYTNQAERDAGRSVANHKYYVKYKEVLKEKKKKDYEKNKDAYVARAVESYERRYKDEEQRKKMNEKRKKRYKKNKIIITTV